MKSLAMIVLCLSGSYMFAGKIGGVTLPDTMTVAGENLMLNGMGLRKKFVVKVYACGLYVKAKTKDAAAVVSADESMALRMHFTYGVSGDQLRDAFNDGFEASIGKSKMGSMQTQIDAFYALFDQKAEKGDRYDIVYHAGKVEVRFNDEVKGAVEGLAFKQAVFGIWLGEKLSDGNLKKVKKGLVGG